MKVRIKKSKGFKGTIKITSDKSISHRAVFIASLASGISEIENFLFAEDCITTLKCLEKLGVKLKIRSDKVTVQGKELYNFNEPYSILNAKNSGTTARFLIGILSGQNFFSIIDGDSSLRNRPMKRVVEPLRKMGAWIEGRNNSENLPIAIRGKELKGIKYKLPIPSAQLKSALIFAGLLSKDETEILEPIPSRDHTERLLSYFGAPIKKENGVIKVKGGNIFPSQKISVPGDFSSASFFITSALLIENSEIIIPDVGLNPTRTGFIRVLKRMGANIKINDERLLCNEPVGTISISPSSLIGTSIEQDEIPSLIDEIPLLMLLATQAKGKTTLKGASELRVKESDRLGVMAENLRKMGVEMEEKEDGFIIEGPQRLKGTRVSSRGDHRIAMTMAIAGLIAEGITEIEDFECYKISFPDFYRLLKNWQDE
ncbi:3-phosphoshikimate 1-carboxyvinyltransferase [Candidatus Aminicenantes bacterium AC-335-A11]|jgi:3-phosphoshikimate 1-carboxyvinyltransferase|nr:3-phosphoshikimate 1-carboxyvinyltransferase [SCandidatus Aminicenantes bacterium Aminicenantia_JdfR_composite]MCP2597091.1 3-phosphoshikimate 1-carboxyvinyltransferase [Candidatus Aminicenantes bacterium AC-335-G13]MCP2605684.1 3-phosphoshikimate 1-carboxyvinyltransferase [Candidatus Aminicenantes bacterium AC-335-O07]MCP2606339.1 3-phosphoshikimate 1-carboxyvinyltransferase [Candidatus Aminicenantes bacterium AC-708-I09]MCP2618712.1 3-phosphoshikimate 1-carboxyvinyltransferase [Candidatus 